jgi:hypothetical protein
VKCFTIAFFLPRTSEVGIVSKTGKSSRSAARWVSLEKVRLRVGISDDTNRPGDVDKRAGRFCVKWTFPG